MSYVENILHLIITCCTHGLVDTLLLELGYDYDTTPGMMGEEIDRDALIRENRWLPEQYQFKDWYNLEQEISAKIRQLKDDNVQLSRYIGDILSPISDSLIMFFPPKPFTVPDSFQIITKYLVYHPDFETIPEPLAKIHERYIDEALQWGDVDFAPEQRDDKIREYCNRTEEALRHCNEIPSWGQCLYFKNLFKRLASILEASLLENSCPKDLFGYQEEYETVLIPYLNPSTVMAERGWSKIYCSQVTRGYTKLDGYTEMAGYGDVGDRTAYDGIEFSHFPELDALLLQTNLKGYSDFPTYHFARFFDRFQAHCKELTESSDNIAIKRRKVFNLVQIIGHCYHIFLQTERLFDYTDYAIRYFSALQAACLRAPEPICVKGMCLDLHFEDMLTDIFPETTIGKVGYLSGKYERTVPWSQYGLEHLLKTSYDYYITEACKQCTRANCPFRDAPSVIPGACIQQKTARPKTQTELLKEALTSVCLYLEPLLPQLLKRKKGKQQWEMSNKDALYAYIVASLKIKYDIYKVDWDALEKVLYRTGDRRYLVTETSQCKDAIKNKKLYNFPNERHLVDDAISKLKL